MALFELRRTAFLRYGLAVAVIIVATLLRVVLEEPLSGGGFMIYFVAVIIASWYGELGPSLVALTLSLLINHWFFALPADAPDPPAKVLAGLGIFLGTGLSTAILSHSLHAARRRAEEADRRKDEFLAILAHELRNPLAPIGLTLDLLHQPGLDEPTTRWVHEVIERQYRHLVRLVDDLLDVSRIARNKIELRNEATELHAVIERAVEASRALVDSKEHRLTVSLPEQPVRLFADPVRLAQVVGNLLNNAAKYTPPGGEILLSAQVVDSCAEIRVRDKGVGIAPEMLAQVFDLFAQAPSAAGVEGGLGIGLSLVKRLVGLMDGSVEAQSDGLGHGSEFIVRLPLPPAERV